ncbi:MAG TPA: hypothetical protein VJG90_08760 [Candidatus Nanoarchaeia archaeon]|nr:hypothetical protein [Candidatus Nanoarchaeia archaeon]
MAKIVVSDTDFLSSFLKIRRLDLILNAFHTKSLLIPQAVAYELRRSTLRDFLDVALTAERIIIQEIKVHPIKGFGLGEIESIALAEKTKGILLMDD